MKKTLIIILLLSGCAEAGPGCYYETSPAIISAGLISIPMDMTTVVCPEGMEE